VGGVLWEEDLEEDFLGVVKRGDFGEARGEVSRNA
jgi:hypothetical protein